MKSIPLDVRLVNCLTNFKQHTQGVYKRIVSQAEQPFQYIWQILFNVYLTVFPRPKLDDEDLQRAATTFADFFAIEIIYNCIDLALNYGNLNWLGWRNYLLYLGIVLTLRHHALKGRLTFVAILYVAIKMLNYLTVTEDNGYFEHLQASNMIIVVGFITITMGAFRGFVALIVTFTMFTMLKVASDNGILTPINIRLPHQHEVSSYKIEYIAIVTNLVEMYLFCWLVRAHIFSGSVAISIDDNPRHARFPPKSYQ